MADQNKKPAPTCRRVIPSSRQGLGRDQHPRRYRPVRAPRAKISHATCPYCGWSLKTRSSRKQSELSTLRYLECSNFEGCGRRFRAVLEIISELRPDPNGRIRGGTALPVEHLLGREQMSLPLLPS